MTLWNRNTEALDQMAVGPVREHEGNAVEPHAEVQPKATRAYTHTLTHKYADWLFSSNF